MSPREARNFIERVLSAPSEVVAEMMVEAMPGALSGEFFKQVLIVRQLAAREPQPNDPKEILRRMDRAAALQRLHMYLLARLDRMGILPAYDDVTPTEEDLKLEEEPVAEDTGSYEQLFRLYKEFVTDAMSKNQISEERQPAMERSMNRLAVVIQGLSSATQPADHSESTEELEERLRQIRVQKSDLLSLATDALSRANKRTVQPARPSGNRAARVQGCLQELKWFVMREGTNDPGTFSINLATRLGHLTKTLEDMGDDDRRLLVLETEEARNLAFEVRLYAHRNHLSLFTPVWPFRNLVPNPNLVFFSGPDNIRKIVESTAGPLGMDVNPPVRIGAELAESRWNDMQAAAIGVFDLSGNTPQVFYELGIAITLGKEVLLLKTSEEALPFDVSQDVLWYQNARALKKVFESELTAAMYGLQCPRQENSTFPDCLAYIERLAEQANFNPLLSVARESLRNARFETVEFGTALDAVNSQLGSLMQLLAFPRWPAKYPDPDSPRCFMVMPFRPEFVRVFEAIKELCSEAAVEPLRGDWAEGQKTIQSIWEEIGQATHVTVDVTGFNPNVCLELGITDTLGRSTMVMGAAGTEKLLHQRLPSIAKRRCHPYCPEDPLNDRQFKDALSKFLT